MQRRHTATVSVLAASLLLAGCNGSIIETKKIDYKSAAKAPTLEVPPDLTVPNRNDRYAVPDSGGKGSATFSTYSAERAAPAGAGEAREVLPAEAGMRVERAGSQRWLVINKTPEELWPEVRNFWIELGFIVNVDSPEIGVMETDWAEDRAKIPQDIIRSTIGKVIDGLYSTPERDKFRTRIEKGTQPGTVEVFISHRGMMEIYENESKATTVWQPRPADPELEAEMLRRLMVHLGAEEKRAEEAVAVAPRPEQATLASSAGKTLLQVDEPFDRAWRRVGLALDRIGFTVQDRNRSEGVYYVRYIDPELDNNSKKPEGFLSKLAFWRSNEKPAVSGSEYRIQVAGENADRSRVRVLTAEGGEDTSQTASKILGLLHEQLK
ncbi:outer membrane protein assembly factor BamC [Denitromonas sp.]|uniref:outer membrane protein assembly factor BamC n=1 Tax=Denitromonas sp. TaxID=2734609 RepID=UPI003A83B78D